MNKEQAEKRALELYPDETSAIPYSQRKAYLQCWEDMNAKQSEKPQEQRVDILSEKIESTLSYTNGWKIDNETYSKMCRALAEEIVSAQPDQLREAAEKALNQNK